MAVSVRRLILYPFKSLDGVDVGEAVALAGAGFQLDRRFALFDTEGRVVNGKRTDIIHALRSQFDLATGRIRVSSLARGSASFSWPADRPSLDAWFSEYFGFPVTVEENVEQGFPDDLDSPGPTLLGSSSLEAVGAWFGGLAAQNLQRRFRANIELDVPVPFWEDRLAGEIGAEVRFSIGEVEFAGVNPCQRCAVPPRDPETGASLAGFQREFARRREETLPAWAPRTRFNHFYRLAINTRCLAGGTVRVGDAVTIHSAR